MSGPLAGRVALVAGATRGAGRGIAVALGAAGAVVYCTGRSSRATPRAPMPGASPFELEHRPETIEDTAERVTEAGGVGVAVRVDHTDTGEVAALAARVEAERGGLDILVNDVWGGESLVEWGTPAWKLDLDKGATLIERGLMSHIITARHLVPGLLARPGGVLFGVTDGDSLAYRGNLFYDLVKTSVIRLAFGYAEELREHAVTSVAISPGFLRSEAMLEHFGVTEATWREGIAQDPHFAQSESPSFVGRGIAALAADPGRFELTGRAFGSWTLAERYGVTDVDGRTPHWGRHATESSFGAEQRAVHARAVAAVSGTYSEP